MFRLWASDAPPSGPVELPDARAGHYDALSDEQRSLEDFATAVAAQTAARSDHAMARHVGTAHPRMMSPTPRAARGRPASAATSP